MAYHSGTGECSGGAAALPYSVLVLMVTLSIDFGIATYYALFRIFDENGCSQHIRKESAKMSAVDKLVSCVLDERTMTMNDPQKELMELIGTLTKEQTEYLCHLIKALFC